MRRKYFTLALTAWAVAACGDVGPAEPDGSLSPVADIYLAAAVDVMQDNSLRKYEIDWVAFREAAFIDAGGAVTTFDTYPAIIAALERIGDGHSFFVASGAQLQLSPAASTASAVGPATVDPMAEMILPGIGYVDVPAFSGGGQPAADLAEDYHRIIESVDTLALTCRWVIDLRGNTGGNMWPMVAGIGPVLGEDTIGFFVDPDSVVSSWFYRNGQSGIDDLVIVDVPTSYELRYPSPWVAVLTDSLTASSGEAVAVAFRGRPGARSFGGRTWGVSTANSAFPLSDGAAIFLTVSTMADRLGTIYGGKLVPDELVADVAKTGDPVSDDVLAAALEWLSLQQCT